MSAVVIAVVAAMLGAPEASVFAAIQGPVDEKFNIPVPKAQRKFAVDEEKGFDGTDQGQAPGGGARLDLGVGQRR